MKTLNYFFAIGISMSMLSCVSSKKFASLNSDYQKALVSQKDCESLTQKMQSTNDDLTKRNKELTDQVDYLKKNSNQIFKNK